MLRQAGIDTHRAQKVMKGFSVTAIMSLMFSFIYYAVSQMGEMSSYIAKKTGISQPAVSLSVERGVKIVKEMGLDL